MNIYTLEVFIITGPASKKFIKKNPVISRTLEILGDQTLVELHEIIFKTFNRFEEHLYEFQVGGKGPNDPKARRYGPGEANETIELAGDVAQTVMDALKLKKDESLYHLNNLG